MKSSQVAYIEYKIKTTNRRELLQALDEAPLTLEERRFIQDIIDGYRIKELAARFNRSESRIQKWKRELCVRLHQYDTRRLLLSQS